MAKNRNRGPLPLSQVLGESMRALGLEKKLREMEIFRHWEEAVGSQIARRATPSHVKNRRLTITVDSPVWAQQLSLLKTDLLKKFEAILGPGVIDDIFLVSGKIEPLHFEEVAPPRRRKAVDPDVLRAIDEEASRIADSDVREAFRRALVAAATRPMEPPDQREAPTPE